MAEPDGQPPQKMDDDLAQLTRTHPNERFSIIVELDVPRPRVETRRDGFTPGRRPWRVVGSEQDRLKADQIMEEARPFLEELAGRPPVWLKASGAFVLDATTEQLETIANSPLVRRISRNRVRR